MKIIIKNQGGEIIKTIDAKVGQTLLKQLTEAGVEMQSACMFGICAACMCQIEKGEECIDKSFRHEPGFPLGDDEVMTCIGGIKKEMENHDGEIILKTIY
ncbi:MAG: 2Fe-2S iron-sulfur cluster-binding protein [Candidatus Altimarinota bacterium]